MKIHRTNPNFFGYFIRYLSLFVLVLPKPALAEIIGKNNFETECQRKIERKWSKESCDGLDHQLQSSKKLNYAFNLVNSNVADGQWAARFELRSDDSDRDEEGKLPVRSEILFSNTQVPVGPGGGDLWYGYKVMVEEYEPDNSWDIIGQGGPVLDASWRGGCDKGPPNYSFGLQQLDNSKFAWVFHLRSMSEDTCRTHKNTVTKKWIFDQAPFELGEWQDIVVNLKSTHEDDGYANIWVNGKQVLSYKGPSGFHPRNIPLSDWRRTLYIKPAGIYKRGYHNQPGDPGRSEKIVVYLDDVRIGKNSSYETMKSTIPSVDVEISSNYSQDQTIFHKLRGYLRSIIGYFK